MDTEEKTIKNRILHIRLTLHDVQSLKDQKLVTDCCFKALDEIESALDAARKETEGLRNQVNGYRDEIKASAVIIDLLRQASSQSHSGHWDKTGGGGSGCRECIRSYEIRERVRGLLTSSVSDIIREIESLRQKNAALEAGAAELRAVLIRVSEHGLNSEDSKKFEKLCEDVDGALSSDIGKAGVERMRELEDAYTKQVEHTDFVRQKHRAMLDKLDHTNSELKAKVARLEAVVEAARKTLQPTTVKVYLLRLKYLMKALKQCEGAGGDEE